MGEGISVFRCSSVSNSNQFMLLRFSAPVCVLLRPILALPIGFGFPNSEFRILP